MKILLTIEEYMERAIRNVMEAATETINPGADDTFKMDFIQMCAEKCTENHFMLVDSANRMFIRTFCYDRNGDMLEDTITGIDEADAMEFNSQPDLKEFNSKRRHSWEQTFEVFACDTDVYGNDVTDDEMKRNAAFTIIDKVHGAATEINGVNNTAYRIACEAFRRLYGHDYKPDREYKCPRHDDRLKC